MAQKNRIEKKIESMMVCGGGVRMMEGFIWWYRGRGGKDGMEGQQAQGREQERGQDRPQREQSGMGCAGEHIIGMMTPHPFVLVSPCHVSFSAIARPERSREDRENKDKGQARPSMHKECEDEKRTWGSWTALTMIM